MLEFNCRMGDPETQPIMLRLKTDLLALIEHALDGTLDQAEAEWDRRAALGVVLAAAGYPDEPRKGDAISGLPKGTRRLPRVPRRHEARRQEGRHQRRPRAVRHGARRQRARRRAARAYETVGAIRFDGMQYGATSAIALARSRALKKA